MIDLGAYRRLTGPWTADQLDTRYRDAHRRGDQLAEGARAPVARAIVALASAIPPSATVDVAIHANAGTLLPTPVPSPVCADCHMLPN